MSSARHKNQTLDQGLHAIVAFSFADATERTAATGFLLYDLYKLAIQLSDGTFWIIINLDGSGNPTWQNLVASTGGAVGGDLSGTLPNPTVVDLHISGQQHGSVIFYNGSHWVVLNPSVDGYVLTTHNTGANPTWSPVITDLSVANQAKGDLLYFDGVNWVVLGAGTDGYVLTAQGVGEDPIWSPSVGGPGGGINISAGTQIATSGTINFINSNGMTFGMSNSNQITASYTVPNINGLISNVNISGGTTSNNLSALVFSNSNNVSFGLNGSTITGSIPNQTAYIFSNSNGLNFGTNGSTITGSYTVPSTAGLISNINISAGTTSNNLSAITFSNSNGLSFGLSGSTITGSYTVPTQTNQTEGMYAIGNTVGQSSSSTFDARTMSISGVGNISVGYSGNALIISAAGGGVANQAGTQTATSGTVIFSNSNGISFGMSNSSIITASYTVPSTAGLISNVNVSAGTTSNNLSAFVFSNSNNVSFGLNGSTVTATISVPAQTNQSIGVYGVGNTTGQSSSSTIDARSLSFDGAGAVSVGYSVGSVVISAPVQTSLSFSNLNGLTFGIVGSTLTGSYTVPTQTNQTIGLYALGNTTQNSSTTLDARTLSFNGLGAATVGYSNGSIQISVPNALTNVNISAGTTSNNLTALTFNNANGISFGLNASIITASYTVPTQSNQTEGMYALGNTVGQSSSSTFDARTMSVSGAGNISVGYSGSALVVSGSQSNQTANIVVPSAGTQTATSGTVVFSNSNGISFGMSNSSVVTASYTVPSTAGLISAINVSAGTTSNNLSAITFSNSNGLSFGLNGSTLTGSYTVPTQTVQTVGLYALGNTTQNSSTTLDARTLSFNGLGAATVGYSNGSIQISVPTATSLNFSNSNNVSFGLNGSTITATASFAQTNQSVGLYALGNTTQNSSTTLDARTLSFNGLGAATVGYSNGSIQISVPTQTAQTQSNIQAIYDGANSISTGTIRFTNANGVSFSINGQTISGSVAAQTAQTVGLYALGNTTQNSSTTLDARTLSFNGLGIITAGYSNGSIQISAVQTNQTEGFYAVGNTVGQSSSSTFDARTFSISGAGIASVGYSAGNLIVSVPSAGALINVSAGTTSNNLGAITFSNSNNVSFGLNGSTITASIPNQTLGLYALGNTTQNSSTTLDARTLSFNGLGAATIGYSNGSIQVSVPVQTNQTEGLYAVGNTVGQSSSSTFDARTMSFSGAGIASVGYSAGNIVISVPSAGALVNFSAGTTSNNLGAVTFSNSNNVSFGLNGSTITASIPNQTIGLYAIGNTTQNSSTTLDARTLSFNGLGAATVGYSNGSIQISVPTQTAQTQSNIQAIYDGVNSISTGTIRFTNANGVSFSVNGQTISASIAAQTNQTIGLYALGNTTQNSSTTLDARTLSFNGLGAATVGYSNGSIQISVPNALTNVNISAGTTSNNLTAFVFSNSNNVSFGLNGSTVTATITVPAQTVQTIGLYGLGNTTQNSSTTLDARTLSFNGLGGATVGYSNGSIQISAPTTAGLISAINVSAGTTSNNLSALTFSNSNGLAFGLNGSTITGSYTVPTQTNQTIGLYALGNTTQNSSTTLDARTLSFNGLGIITAGYSNGSIQISATQSAQTQNVVVPSAGTQTATSGTVIFSNSNGISFGMSNSSVITASYTVPTQTAQTIGLYALGNTTQNSSTTLDARTLSFNGLGAITVGYSNGSIQVSAPVQTVQTQSNIQAIYDGTNSVSTGTIRFTNANGVSFSINGQTLSASIAPRKVFQLGPDSPWQTNFSISNASMSLQHFIPRADIVATQANLLMALSGNTNSSGALTISLGAYTMAGSTMSLVSSTSRQITWTSGSQTTASSLYGGISGTCYRTVALGNWSFTAGDYMLGAWCRTTNNGTWLMFGTQGPSIVNAQDVNETQMYLPGYFSTGSFSTAMVASINLTDTNYVRTGVPVLQQPSIIFIGTV